MLPIYVPIVLGINALALGTASPMMATRWGAATGDRRPDVIAKSAALLWFL